MGNTLTLVNSNEKIKIAVLDILAISFVYFVPTLSHLLSVPLYLLEPMRIMLILSLAHTRKENAYILALTLPAFSFLVSGHPNVFKAGLIALELLLNTWLFFAILGKTKNKIVSIFSSIVISKAVYYGLKFALISSAILSGDLIATPLYLQLITAIAFTLYIQFLFKNDSLSNEA
jgi:hypothetical protein